MSYDAQNEKFFGEDDFVAAVRESGESRRLDSARKIGDGEVASGGTQVFSPFFPQGREDGEGIFSRIGGFNRRVEPSFDSASPVEQGAPVPDFLLHRDDVRTPRAAGPVADAPVATEPKKSLFTRLKNKVFSANTASFLIGAGATSATSMATKAAIAATVYAGAPTILGAVGIGLASGLAVGTVKTALDYAKNRKNDDYSFKKSFRSNLLKSSIFGMIGGGAAQGFIEYVLPLEATQKTLSLVKEFAAPVTDRIVSAYEASSLPTAFGIAAGLGEDLAKDASHGINGLTETLKEQFASLTEQASSAVAAVRESIVNATSDVQFSEAIQGALVVPADVAAATNQLAVAADGTSNPELSRVLFNDTELTAKPEQLTPLDRDASGLLSPEKVELPQPETLQKSLAAIVHDQAPAAPAADAPAVVPEAAPEAPKTVVEATAEQPAPQAGAEAPAQPQPTMHAAAEVQAPQVAAPVAAAASLKDQIAQAVGHRKLPLATRKLIASAIAGDHQAEYDLARHFKDGTGGLKGLGVKDGVRVSHTLAAKLLVESSEGGNRYAIAALKYYDVRAGHGNGFAQRLMGAVERVKGWVDPATAPRVAVPAADVVAAPAAPNVVIEAPVTATPAPVQPEVSAAPAAPVEAAAETPAPAVIETPAPVAQETVEVAPAEQPVPAKAEPAPVTAEQAAAPVAPAQAELPMQDAPVVNTAPTVQTIGPNNGNIVMTRHPVDHVIAKNASVETAPQRAAAPVEQPAKPAAAKAAPKSPAPASVKAAFGNATEVPFEQAKAACPNLKQFTKVSFEQNGVRKDLTTEILTVNPKTCFGVARKELEEIKGPAIKRSILDGVLGRSGSPFRIIRDVPNFGMGTRS